MQFRIADTFTDGLARLTGEEQKAVKTTTFDLQMNPVNPGMQFHRVNRARDRRFWSVRVSDDLRLIVHRTDSSLLLCYVDHHDPAYSWAERRKLETHPKTGAAQVVEIREIVKRVTVPRYVPETSKGSLFASVSDDTLRGYGEVSGARHLGTRHLGKAGSRGERCQAPAGRFGTDFTEEDKVFIRQLEDHLAGDPALVASVRVNPPENARLTFDHVVSDRLQDMVETNFKFYKRVADDHQFAKYFLDWLFDRFLEKHQMDES